MAAATVHTPTVIPSAHAADVASHRRSTSISNMPSQRPEPDDDGQSSRGRSSSRKAARPGMGSRKSSGTIIIPRDSPTVEAVDEQYDADDARAMSPRRSNDEVEKMGDDARQALEEQARALQENLMEIIDRVDTVKSEHEKLEGGNKFLQSYIGELMQTSKMTPAGAPKGKGKGKTK